MPQTFQFYSLVKANLLDILVNQPFISVSNKSFATALLHLQCWSWGCDIRNSSGNILLKQGFDRVQPPKEVRGSSCYSTSLPSDNTVLLWGFGVAILDNMTSIKRTGIYLNRYNFEPCLIEAPREPIHAPAQLVHLNKNNDNNKPWSEAICLLVLLTSWIASYEETVETQWGDAYRLSCLSKMPEPELCILGSMATAWRSVSDDLSKLSTSIVT